MSIFMDAESRTNPAIAARAQARKDQIYTIELKIYDDPDTGHRVMLHSEKLDALRYFRSLQRCCRAS